MQLVLEAYPRIYFACHTRHVRDPRTQREISTHQASILDHLDDVEPITVRDLARHMGVTASTMSLSLDRLARDGYITRSRDRHDRRVVGVRITRAGGRVRASCPFPRGAS